MSKTTGTAFTNRQNMIRPDFEFFHTIDEQVLDIEYHNHDFYEIFFFISGHVEYVIEGKIYALRPGSEMLTGLRRLCAKMEASYSNPAYGYRILMHAYMMEFLVFLNRACLDTPAEIQIDITENATVNEVIAFINQNLSEDLSLDLLAGQLHISKFYLGNQFKQYTGFTLYQYILKKRLIAARQLLQQHSSVMNACQSCGFNDYSNFLKAFKQEFCILPSTQT